MALQIVKKVLSIIPLMLVVSILLFILINALPGDASMSVLTEATSQEYVDAMREKMGLDKPPVERYFVWLRDALRGNLGSSLLTSETVSEKLALRFPITMEITLVAMLISVLIALPLGVLSAIKRNSIYDVAGSLVSMVGVAMPSFWLGLLLVMYFAVGKRWLPASGFVPFSEDPIANIRSIILPCISIGFGFAATIMRQTRSALLEVLEQDYILTARAKGVKEKVVIWRHAMRNALIPVLTVTAMQIGRLIGGAVVTETVFAIPGMGDAIVSAITNRDYPVAMGMIIVVVAVVVSINTIVDVLYLIIDPRISTKAKKG